MSRPLSRKPRSFDHIASARLAQAVRANDVEAARRALAAGADPNLRGPRGALNQTSLVDAAVESGAHAVLAILLEHGARVVPPRTDGMTLSLSGTAVHAAARALDDAALRVFEAHRKVGPMVPLDENGHPPLAHALRGKGPRFLWTLSTSSPNGGQLGNAPRSLCNPNPEVTDSALVKRWLSSPRALKDKPPGQATFAVLDAFIGTVPGAFLDNLLAAGLDPGVCAPEHNPLVNAASRWNGLGVPPTNATKVKAWVEEWTVALAREGVSWPSAAVDTSLGEQTLRAMHEAACLGGALEDVKSPAHSEARRLRL